MSWDPAQYEALAAPRWRAYLDLVDQVRHDAARNVVDAGCGTGRTTAHLAQRFPKAQVVGIDASAQMLARAAAATRIRFEQADLAAWSPPEPADVVVANAVLHWLPDQEAAVQRLASWIAAAGVLAFQVPAMQDAASHRIVGEAARRPGVRERLAGLRPGGKILALEEYASVLEGLGFDVEAWSTTYRMRLPPGGVLEWLKGTTLRPYIAALGQDAEAWVAELATELAAAYPEDDHGVIYPFQRHFVVARRL